MKPYRPLSKKVVYAIAIASVLFAAYVLVPAAGYAGPGETKPAQAAGVTHAPARPRNDVAGIRNFAQVSDALFRGDQPDEAGFRELKKMGVKTVVNLRSFHSDAGMLEGLGLNYVQIKLNYLDPRDAQVAAFLKVVTDPELKPVFVHCRHGSDRTGTMVAAYRMVVEGWDSATAMEELPIFGFHEIWQSLRAYLEDFNAEAMRSLMKKVQMPKVTKFV